MVTLMPMQTASVAALYLFGVDTGTVTFVLGISLVGTALRTVRTEISLASALLTEVGGFAYETRGSPSCAEITAPLVFSATSEAISSELFSREVRSFSPVDASCSC